MSLPLRAYWPRQPRHFGHWLTGAILGQFGIGVEWSPPGHAELAGSGAVLDFLPAETSAVVIGCGFHLADAIVSYPRIRPYAVRGRLSAEKLGLPPGAVLADLGLLADILVTSVAPGPLLGIVADGEDQWVVDFCQRHPDQLVLIDSRTVEAAQVVVRLAACRAILSTSVSGLAAAWACGIPAAGFHLADRTDEPDFELRDFHSAFGLPAESHPLGADDSPESLAARCRPPPSAVAEKKHQLRETIRRASADLASSATLATSQGHPGPAATPLESAIGALAAGRPETALRLLQATLVADPDNARLHRELGCAWSVLGEHQNAAAELLRATKLDPADAVALGLLGRIFHERNQAELSLAAYAAAARSAPDSTEARNKHALALINVGRLDDGLAELRQITSRYPDFRKAHDNLLYYLQLHPATDRAILRAERALWNRRHAAPLAPSIRPHRNLPDPERPLNIGYVSPDFRHHAQSFFTLPLFSHHARGQFRVFAYSLGREPDRHTHLLRAQVPHWREVGRLSDDAVAERIRADGIDLLVDLTHHMAGNRLPIFARKPAPLQVAWVGYPGGTGLETIDYHLTDACLEPPGTDDELPFEKPFWLRDCYWCYHPLAEGPSVNPLPAAVNGHVTFGCLNTFAKVNEATLALWTRVLHTVPRSRLILLVPAGSAVARVHAAFAREGVSPERIIPIGRRPRASYLALHQRIDVALDPIPVGGHTTLCDGLWMGVPTVTLPGETAISRGGLSLLAHAGLADWVANSADNYVQLALEKTRDLPRLAELRAGLRACFEASVVMDAPRFARSVEAAYRSMWRNWCARPPRG